MKALQFRRNLPRYAAARLAGSFTPGRGAAVGPLELVDLDPPAMPGPDWVRVRPRLSGICGSDLATIDHRTWNDHVSINLFTDDTIQCLFLRIDINK